MITFIVGLVIGVVVGFLVGRKNQKLVTVGVEEAKAILAKAGIKNL